MLQLMNTSRLKQIMKYVLQMTTIESLFCLNTTCGHAWNQKMIFSMYTIIGIVLTIFSPLNSQAQTVVFETNVVDFSMELNPTSNPNLQGHVDNFLNYVRSGIYNGSIINRSVKDFVIQMGNFTLSPPLVSNLTSEGFTRTTIFDPVVVDADGNGLVDFDTTGLSNTRGEVSLALLGGQPNSGTNSFFINLGDNSFLDTMDFIPFARIADMEPINRIAELETVDFSRDLVISAGSLIYADVPVVNSDFFLVLENVRVVPEPTGFALVAIGVLLGVTSRRRRVIRKSHLPVWRYVSSSVPPRNSSNRSRGKKIKSS